VQFAGAITEESAHDMPLAAAPNIGAADLLPPANLLS
jgi:hypothetical protein